MSTLRGYANDTGQWGEGGMIAEALRRMGISPTFAVEFGAGEDPALLNTLDLARLGVNCLWAEADEDRLRLLQIKTASLSTVTHRWCTVTSVDELCEGMTPDVLSIDVDGEDYRLFGLMTIRPPLLVIEHNPTVPPDTHWIGRGPRQGASAHALVGLAASKGYGLVGATGANLIFVRGAWLPEFDDLETALETIFDRSQLNYVISDYDGNWQPTGPWAWGRRNETDKILVPEGP